MPVLLIVLGLLLLLFGGGCTLLMGGFVLYDPGNAAGDAAIMLSYWLPLGLAPLAAGTLLMRVGIRQDRARRARAAAGSSPQPGKEP